MSSYLRRDRIAPIRARLAEIRSSDAGIAVTGAALCIFMALFYLVDDRTQRDFFYLAVLPSALLLTGVARLRPAARTSVVALCALWLAWSWTTLLWSSGVDVNAVINALRRGVLALVFVVVTATVLAWRPAMVRWFIAAMALVALAAGLASLPSFLSGTTPGSRLVLIAQKEDIIDGATLLGAAASLCLALAIQPGRRSDRMAAAAAAAALFVLVLLTQSRGALLATLAAGLALLAARRARRALLVSAVALAAATVLIASPWDVTGLLSRGDSYRLMLWAEALDHIAERPLFGYGLQTDFVLPLPDHPTVFDPHNIYLTNHMVGGVPATLLLLALFARMSWLGWREATAGRVPLALATAIYGGATGMFHYGRLVNNADPSWIFFWLPAACAAAAELHLAQAQRTGKA